MSDLPSAGALAGRVVLVTGAAGGVGRECALAAAREGAAVVVSDVDAGALEGVAAQVAHAEADVLAVPADVTDEQRCRDLVTAGLDRFGRLDGAVLAAGIARHVPLLEMTRAQWDGMLAVHLTGAFLCLQAAASAMVRAGGGSVVYIASTVAAGLGPLHQAHYVAAKAGALGLVRAAARELGPEGVRVNAVSPGFLRTPMNDGLFTDEEIRRRVDAAPLGRLAGTGDVADSAVFLLSDRSSLITGQNLQVDGGASMS